MGSPSESLFIGDLPAEFDDETLNKVFGAYGTIKSSKLMAPGGKGNRAAIVTFGTQDEATWIVDNLNGNIPQGLQSAITVKYKQSKGDDKGKGTKAWDGGKGGDKGWGGYSSWETAAPVSVSGEKGAPPNSTPSESLFIGDLPAELDEEALTKVFAAYGTIQSSKLMPPGGKGNRAAIVTFATQAEATWIVDNLNGNIPQGLQSAITAKYKALKGEGKGKNAWDGGKGGDKGWGGHNAWDAGGWNAGNSWDQSGAAPAWGGGAAWQAASTASAVPVQPSSNLFVGGLPADFDEQKLQTVFGAYGTISSSKLLEPNGLGKRAALINFDSAEEAKWIVDNLNGNIAEGLTEPVNVSFSRTGGKAAGSDRPGPYSDGGKGGGKDWGASQDWGKGGGKDWGKDWSKGGGKDAGKGGTGIKVLVKGLYDSGAMPGGTRNNDANALFVGGLPSDTTDLDLYKMFASFGGIATNGVKAMLMDDQMTCKGFGFINFIENEPARNAVQTLNGTVMPDGKTLTVRIKTDKAADGGKGFDKGKGW